MFVSFCKRAVESDGAEKVLGASLVILLFAVLFSASGCSPIGGDSFGGLANERPLVLPGVNDDEIEAQVQPESFEDRTGQSSFLTDLTAVDPATDWNTLDREQLAQRKARLLDALGADLDSSAPDPFVEPTVLESVEPAAENAGENSHVIRLVATTDRDNRGVTVQPSGQPENQRHEDHPHDVPEADSFRRPLLPLPAAEPVHAVKSSGGSVATVTGAEGQQSQTTVGHSIAQAVDTAAETNRIEVEAIEPEINPVIRSIPRIHDTTLFNTVEQKPAATDELGPGDGGDWQPPNTDAVRGRDFAIPSGKKIACCDSPATCRCDQEHSSHNSDAVELAAVPELAVVPTRPAVDSLTARTVEQKKIAGMRERQAADFEGVQTSDVELVSFEQPVENRGRSGDFLPQPSPENAEAVQSAVSEEAGSGHNDFGQTPDAESLTALKLPRGDADTVADTDGLSPRQKLQRSLTELTSSLAEMQKPDDAVGATDGVSSDGNQVTLRLLNLIGRKLEQVQDTDWKLTADEAGYWNRQLDTLAVMLDVNKVAAGQATDQHRHQRALNAIKHLNLAKEKLQAMAGLELTNGHLCEEVSGFGQYQPFARNEFQPGDWALLYIEVANFQSESVPGQTHVSVGGTANETSAFRTRLRASYAIYDQQGKVVQQKAFPVIEDIARRHRQDFYLHLPVEVADLSAGKYQLQLVVEDVAAVAAATLQPPLDFIVR